MGEHGRAILGDVSVKQDACLGIAQQPRQHSLALKKRAIAQILAIMLDKVEGIKDGGSSGLSTGTTPRTVTSRQARAQPPRRQS
jgi:hypothetical protein